MIGSKDGPVGVAFANALATQSAGHTNLLRLEPNVAIKPATVMITKVTIKGMKQAVQMFGLHSSPLRRPLQTALALASSLRIKPKTSSLFAAFSSIQPPKTTKKIYQYNYEATNLPSPTRWAISHQLTKCWRRRILLRILSRDSSLD